MEAPDRPNSVLPIAASAHHSRLGPEIGGGKGGFHHACTGKYFYDLSPSLRDEFSHTQILNTASIQNEATSLSSLLTNGSTSHPGRTVDCIMEVPRPSTSVAPFPASVHHCRPGPECSCASGVFQIAMTGKYKSGTDHSLPEVGLIVNAQGCPIRRNARDVIMEASPFSTSTLHQPVPSCSSWTPGRTVESILEAPGPSDAVAPLADIAHRSRPGPAIGSGEGGFRTPNSGEYTSRSALEHALPTVVVNSSDELFHDQCSSNRIPESNDVSPTIAASDVPSAFPTHLRVYYQNVRGLRTKVDAFFLAATECNYDVIVLTETWLDDRLYSAQFFGNEFVVYRNDRNASNSSKTRGGGVLIAVSHRWNSCIDPTPISDALEQLWVRISTPNRVVSVGVIYLPPDRRYDIDCIQNHVSSIGAVASNLEFSDYALQFGDYNQPLLRWSESDNGTLQVEPQMALPAASAMLIDGFSLHGLSQINGISNRNARFLDLVLCNEAATSACAVTEAIEPLTSLDPDHPALDVLMSLPEPIVFEDCSEDNHALDFRRADYAEISSAISRIDWRPLDSAGNVDDAVEYFNQMIWSIIAEFVPAARPTPKPPWSNGHLRRLKRNRAKALRRYCRYRSYITKQEFNRTSTAYRRHNRFLYRRYVIRTQSSLRRNPKRFWSFVNSKRNEVGLPLSVNLGDQTASSAPEKCRLFAQHFMNSFSETSASLHQVAIATSNSPRDAFEFRPFHISEDTVSLALRRLKLSFAAGPDGIPSSVLKLCSEVMLIPLAKLFNLSLQESRFPEAWKFSFMFPVHKKGDKRNVQNYRGITSLCCCSKVFEIIMNEALFSSCKNYISTAQHGFYPKRSVMTNLTEFVSLCIRTMDSGGQVDAVYTDLKAAFDRVDHRILLSRLEKLGVSGSLISWFQSYLTNRSLCVKIGASSSEVFTNVSGVPQGSNLGPLLFSLFINELSFLLPPGCRLFYADDVKMYMIINSIADCEELQLIVDRMQVWCYSNFLTLSINKCSVISFHRKQKPILYCYAIAGQTLERVSQIRDLGVTLDSELTFKPHYNDILTKANRQLGFMFKISEDFRDPLCLRALYCSLVRSILEFSSVVWCPYQACWTARLESVQKKFVRYALRHLPWRDTTNLPSYTDRCRLLGISTLEQRRRNAQALFAAKIITGEIDSPELLLQLSFYAPERVMRQRNFIHLPARNRLYGQNEPIRAIASAFNNVYDLFDFNVPLNVFIGRLSRF